MSSEFTEEEQGRYDRQIRLWGLEAQQRMKSATILVVRLRGTATEVIKNIVLAGIGKIIIVDEENVAEMDLGAGFFYRDEDVGKKRVDAAKARVESLNPLVTVQVIPTFSVLQDEHISSTLENVDLVCVTDWDRDGIACRRLNKPLYTGGNIRSLGHEYITPYVFSFRNLLFCSICRSDRSGSKDSKKDFKTTAIYTPLSDALKFKWSSLTKRQTKELNPAPTFGILAVWEYQSSHQGVLPSDVAHAEALRSVADSLISGADVNKQILATAPEDLIQSLATTAGHEFSPVCAVVGGMLAQDILKTLAAREAPLANLFVFDGNTGGGTVCRMNMPSL
ncbi:hypothetical protein C8J56DRAFT_979563 [Mycena floridula]|nr:hypothetical protein C8J56DRAFT_979563 [Mycena floridula]